MSPISWDNRSTVTMKFTGTNFFPNDLVVFQPDATIVGPEVGKFQGTADNPSAPAPTTLQQTMTAKVQLATAPPGRYRVTIVHSDGVESGSPQDPNFTIIAYGGANARGVQTGVNEGSVDPFGFDCDFEILTVCDRGTRALDITGSNIAVGAKVNWLGANGLPVPGFAFTPGEPNNSYNTPQTRDSGGTRFSETGYPSSTLLQGNYTYPADNGALPGFTPGFHQLQVVNTDGQTTGTTVAFAQPWYAAPTQTTSPVSPTAVGAGASNVVITLTAKGMRAGTALSVEGRDCSSTTATENDVTMGASTLSDPAGDGTFNTLSAPLSLLQCADAGTRGVTVVSPDGARFSRPGILQVTGFPHVTSIVDTPTKYSTLGQGAHVGFVQGSEVTISGTNFVDLNAPSASPKDTAKMTRFDFGPDVVVTTKAVISTGTALVTIDVGSNAATGRRNVKAINPDGGASSTGQPTLQGGQPDPTKDHLPFYVSAGPKITSVSPSSFATTEARKTVTVTGSNFNSGINDNSITITPSGINFDSATSPDTKTVTFSAYTSNATPGARDLAIENPNDFGRVVCTACLGVDSLTITKVGGTPVLTQATAPDTGSWALTFQGTGMQAVTSASTATLTRQVPLPGQGPIVGTGLAGGLPSQASATFDLMSAAPGRYNVKVVLDPATTPASSQTTWSCNGCLVVSGDAITTTSIAPATGGQGAANRVVTITGTNFSKGMSVTIPDVTVHDVTLVSPTSLTASLDIATDAATGAKAVTVTAGDGSSPSTATGSKTTNLSFTVNPAPTVTGISPTSYGAGAGSAGSPTPAPKVTVTGQGFVSSPATQVDLGSDVAATDEAVTQGQAPTCLPDPIGCSGGTDDSVQATVAISQAAALGKRAVRLVNDDGGVATLADAFTVNQGPRVLSVADETGAPVLRPDGVKHVMTILGSGFSTDANGPSTVAFSPNDGFTMGAVTVASPTKITVEVTVPADATLSARTVSVSNPGDKGFGSCPATPTPCVAVAKLPGTPGSLKLVGGAASLAATWTAAAPNGATITNYHVTIAQGTTVLAAVDVSGTTLTKTFTGLTNGTSYVISVYAVNAAGKGATASATGIAGVVTKLTSVASSKLVISGSAVRFSGKLLAGTAPVSGRTIKLRFTPSVGTAFAKYVTTNTAGAWAYVYATKYTFRMTASYAGDATYRASTATSTLVYVKAKVVKASPASGSTSSASTTLRITGYVAPNKHGKVVYLQRYTSSGWVTYAKATLTSTSTYTFAVVPKKGTYTFRVYIGATTGNLAGVSPNFTLKRV